MRYFAIFTIAALSFSACGTPSQVRFVTDGMHYESGPVAVRFKNSVDHEFIDGNWKIDNWQLLYENPVTEKGAIQAASPKNPFVRKSGSPYEGTLRIDMDNNGKVEDFASFFTDLELRNAETDGQIWVLMRELPKHHSSLKLEAVLDAYAENLSLEDFTRKAPYDIWVLQKKSYAARVVSREAVKLGPYDALIATIELANLAQLQLDPKSRMGSVRVLLARVPGFSSPVFGDPDLEYNLSIPRSGVGLLVVGYYDSATFFEKGLPDFEAFLGQFTVDGKPISIVRGEKAPTAEAAPPSPAPEPAPVPEPAPIAAPAP